MRFNSIISEEPHQGLTSWMKLRRKLEPPQGHSGQVLHGCRQFVPWGVPLSGVTNATLVPCYKCHGRRSLFLGRKEGMTSSQHGPYALGDTHGTMAATKGCQAVRRSQSLKSGLSSDWGLQLDLMKPESLVIADQPRRGEYVPELCTHRPSHQGSWLDPKFRAIRN